MQFCNRDEKVANYNIGAFQLLLCQFSFQVALQERSPTLFETVSLKLFARKFPGSKKCDKKLPISKTTFEPTKISNINLNIKFSKNAQKHFGRSNRRISSDSFETILPKTNFAKNSGFPKNFRNYQNFKLQFLLKILQNYTKIFFDRFNRQIQKWFV